MLRKNSIQNTVGSPFVGRFKPKVTVCVMTYNQVKYIRQCLQSIVDQKTDFPFEVIVGDDCSTDGTTDIVREFAEKYPLVIRAYIHLRNMGWSENYKFIYSHGVGQYLAHMDGDDYMLPNKLQAQANYLDDNQGCTIVWHRAITITPSGEVYVDNLDKIPINHKYIDIDLLISNTVIGLNVTRMFRRSALFQQHPQDLDVIDSSENILIIKKGGGYGAIILGESLAVYRAQIGISKINKNKIKITYMKWLLYFYNSGVASQKTINAKIFLILVSDIKNLQITMPWSLFYFMKTISKISPREITRVYKMNVRALNKFLEL